MAALLGAAEYVLPGWIFQFYNAVRLYQSYMAGTSFLDCLVTPRWSGFAAILVVVPVLWALWEARAHPPETAGASRAMCLSLAAAVCTAPNLAVYNQVLLLPGVLLWLNHEWRRPPNPAARRLDQMFAPLVLALGYLFGLANDQLQPFVASTATRTVPEIRTYLDSLVANGVLDIDHNGETSHSSCA